MLCCVSSEVKLLKRAQSRCVSIVVASAEICHNSCYKTTTMLHHFSTTFFTFIHPPNIVVHDSRMSRSIFASLANVNLTAPPPPQSSSPSLLETPSVGQKCAAPPDFETDQSQQTRRVFSSSSTTRSQPPLPSISSLNVASAMRHYLSNKNASVDDIEEVIRFINMRYIQQHLTVQKSFI